MSSVYLRNGRKFLTAVERELWTTFISYDVRCLIFKFYRARILWHDRNPLRVLVWCIVRESERKATSLIPNKLRLAVLLCCLFINFWDYFIFSEFVCMSSKNQWFCVAHNHQNCKLFLHFVAKRSTRVSCAGQRWYNTECHQLIYVMKDLVKLQLGASIPAMLCTRPLLCNVNFEWFSCFWRSTIRFEAE